MLEDKLLKELFANYNTINHYILHKYNNDYDNLTVLDHLIFQYTSNSISLISELLLWKGIHSSIEFAFTVRSLIEIMSVMNYALEKEDEEATELIKIFYFINEYIIYKRYPILEKTKTFNLDEMNLNNNNARYIFKECKNMSNSELNKFIKSSKIPWSDNDYNYEKLISKLDDNYLTFYKILSIFIHPNYLGVYEDIIVKTFSKEIVDNFVSKCLLFGTKYFDKYKGISIEYEDTYEYYSKELISINNPLSVGYQGRKQLNLIAKEYTKILNKNYQFDSSIKFVFAEYGFFIQQAFMDIAMGYSEIFKSKIKPIFEMLAINNYLNNQMRDKEKYEFSRNMVHNYTLYSYYNSIGDYDKANEMYEKGFENAKSFISDITREEFESRFKSVVKAIDPNLSINNLVHSFINDVCDMEYDQDAELNKASFNMLYDESQMLSHGNGYSLEANQGAFADVNITLVACEKLFLYFVKNLCENLKFYKVEESKGLNGFIYDMEHKFIKRYDKSSNEILVLKLILERFAVKIE